MMYERFFGHHHRESNTPITRESEFRIGSNSKTFTTMAIFQLGNSTESYFRLEILHVCAFASI